VDSRPREIGFSFRRNQCIMVYSLALKWDAVHMPDYPRTGFT
jgi:hypothetical protein